MSDPNELQKIVDSSKQTRRYSLTMDVRLWRAVEYVAFRAEMPIRQTLAAIIERYLVESSDDGVQALVVDAILWRQSKLEQGE